MSCDLFLRKISPSMSQRGLVLFLLLICVARHSRTVQAQAGPLRRMLIVNEVGPSYPLINLVDQGIRAALANSPYKVEVYREYMETVLFPDPADYLLFRDFYIRKYEKHKPDLIITVGSSSLRLMTETHRSAFPDVPVIFCFPSAPVETVVRDPEFTGVEGDIAAATTIAAALRLLPEEHTV